MPLKNFLPFCLLVFVSCKTYTISPASLYVQIHSAAPEEVRASHSAGGMYNGFKRNMVYTANGVTQIVCYDKRGNETIIPNSPRVEMRIKTTSHKTYNFYFDTVNLRDSVFTGCNSRILNLQRSVKLSDIKTVQIQKGAKKYGYVDNKRRAVPDDE